jgi:hypothetical protein
MKQKTYEKMHVVAVDMGYGHQRAAYPFLDVAKAGIITANNYPGISEKERKDWIKERKGYEIISAFKKTPIIGNMIFNVMDYFQRIHPFYPRRDLSRPSIQQLMSYKKVKDGQGRELIAKLNQEPLPLLTSFFVAAYFAEYYGYTERIYCIICDADIARAWAPIEPKISQVIYLVPNSRVKERLQLYGVKQDHIFLTGFPLPKENVGGRDMRILKEDLKARLVNLDPNGLYRNKYKKLIEDYLCPIKDLKSNHILTITFAVGGAGAQKNLGVAIMKSLRNQLKKGVLGLNLVAGSRKDVSDFFNKSVKDMSLDDCSNVKVIYHPNKLEYFRLFNEALRTSDILWTKPSELTFYCGLGLPIIMSGPIGSQENYNRRWLIGIGAGMDSKNPENANEWLVDWINSGWLAEAAMQGFIDAPKLGTYNIEDLVLRGSFVESDQATNLL